MRTAARPPTMEVNNGPCLLLLALSSEFARTRQVGVWAAGDSQSVALSDSMCDRGSTEMTTKLKP